MDHLSAKDVSSLRELVLVDAAEWRSALGRLLAAYDAHHKLVEATRFSTMRYAGLSTEGMRIDTARALEEIFAALGEALKAVEETDK